MKVVILCGGKGTRLREETEYRPKPMVPIGGRPILWHIMKTYAHYGHTDFVLCLGYKGEVIIEYFRHYRWMASDVTMELGADTGIKFHGDYSESKWKVTLVDTGQETQTGARISRIRKYVEGEETFLLSYGDCVGNIPISETIDFHRSLKKTLTLTAVHPPGRFGELRLDEDPYVTAFNEKAQVTEGYISGGYFVVSQRIFDYLDNRDDLHFEREPIQQLTMERELVAFKHDDFWYPMDTYAEFLLLNQLWKEGRAPWRVW